jgi:hypothetical protein
MNIQENIFRIKEIMGLIVEQESQGPTEQDLIGELESSGFKKYTTQEEADKDFGPGKINLSLAEWVYGNLDEGLYCNKLKNGKIFFGRVTTFVKNPKFFSKYRITEPTDVGFRTYSFVFPLQGDDVTNYNNAIQNYITNRDKLSELITPDENVLLSFIKQISEILRPMDERNKNSIQNGLNQARQDLQSFPEDKKAFISQEIEKVAQDAKSLGYQVS